MIRTDVQVIAECARRMLDIAKNETSKKEPEAQKQTPCCTEAVVSAAEINGDKFVRVHVGKYDFCVALHDAEKTMPWDDAMKYAADKGMRLFTLEEGLLMYCFKDEINAKLVELGGDKLREDDWYWCSTEGDRTVARFVYFGNGYASINGKSGGYVVRPVAAFKPCA